MSLLLRLCLFPHLSTRRALDSTVSCTKYGDISLLNLPQNADFLFVCYIFESKVKLKKFGYLSYKVNTLTACN